MDPEKGVETLADALQGASDIIAETLKVKRNLQKTRKNSTLHK